MSTRLEVLRLGHRPSRDKRLSTHVCLAARALGADRVYMTSKDSRVEESVRDVVERWGGDFEVVTGVDWRALVDNWSGMVVHLTMKGEPLAEAEEGLVDSEDILAVVGSGKVPADIYRLADLNVAVTPQPHSEVAALAVLMDRILAP